MVWLMAKRRKYNESYLGFGLTTVTGRDGTEKPQCVICHDVLCAESMKPSKLKRHLQTKHPKYQIKTLDYLKKTWKMIANSKGLMQLEHFTSRIQM